MADPVISTNGNGQNDPQKAVFINPQVQQELNTPLIQNQPVNAEDQVFLDLLIGLVKDGKINLYSPDSLINHAVYDKLSTQDQGKADLEAMNMLADIREIKGLYDADYKKSYQIIYLVNALRLSKERLEEKGGDLFII